ncbi:MAG: ABC transporter permease [Chlamydiales bacterium]|nr:ABC transporter permease [Chlamydiales bacterium]
MKGYIAATLTYLFLYIPIAVLIVFSFNSRGFPASWDHFTLQWYQKLFQEPDLWTSFLNSLIVSSLATLLSVTMGALLIFLHANGGKISNFIPLFYGNLIIPETILAMSLISFFAMLHIPLGIHTLVVGHTLLGLGFVIPIVFLRYSELDPRLKEASMDLGATSFQTFRKIILPLMRPALIASGLLVFVISFDDFILSYFCSGSSFQTLSIYLVSSLRFGISPVVNALATLLLILTSTLVMIFFSPKVRTRVF